MRYKSAPVLLLVLSLETTAASALWRAPGDVCVCTTPSRACVVFTAHCQRAFAAAVTVLTAFEPRSDCVPLLEPLELRPCVPMLEPLELRASVLELPRR
eukprot:1952385-Prymnesium_polylepis.1